MSIIGLAGNRVEFRTHVIALRPRVPPAVLADHGRINDRLVRACAWCMRIEVEGEWIDVTQATARLQLFMQGAPGLTHGICPDCLFRLYPA